MHAVSLNDFEHDAILEVLQTNPKGISEYHLLKRLFHQHNVSFSDPLDLFRQHFMLFHQLYKLRDYLLSQQTAVLEISTIKIQLHPYSNSKASLKKSDRLRSYYLDLENLKATSELDIEHLLGSFWRRFLSAEDKTDALRELGLDADAEYDEIVFRYRSLVAKHHPDRGGKKEKIQKLNMAMDVLKRHYQIH